MAPGVQDWGRIYILYTVHLTNDPRDGACSLRFLSGLHADGYWNKRGIEPVDHLASTGNKSIQENNHEVYRLPGSIASKLLYS